MAIKINNQRFRSPKGKKESNLIPTSEWVMKSREDGTVYVLTNPAMPDLVKIGKTTRDVSLRLSDLYTRGVPLPFECEYAAKVKDVDQTD